MTAFVQINPPDPVNDRGVELAVFDRAGMIAASYCRVGQVYHTWEYNRDDAGIARWLILDTEGRARALCLAISERRGPHPVEGPPDLDDMLRDVTR